MESVRLTAVLSIYQENVCGNPSSGCRWTNNKNTEQEITIVPVISIEINVYKEIYEVMSDNDAR